MYSDQLIGSYDFLIEKSPMTSNQDDLVQLFEEITNEVTSSFDDLDFVQDSSSGSDVTPPHQPVFYEDLNFGNSLDLFDTKPIKEEPSVVEDRKSKRKREERERELDKLSQKPEVFTSPQEEQEWKKQKRMIRNRLSAQASREKKRGQLEEYEKLNETLNQEMKVLREENEKLKKEVVHLRTKLNYYEPQQPGNRKTMMVFVFLFTIGLFFKFGSFPTLATTSSTSQNLPLQTRGGGRVLHGVDRNYKSPQLVLPSPVDSSMSNEKVYFESNVSDFLLKDILKENYTKEEEEVTNPLHHGIIFHSKGEKDGIYFMCPIIYPLFSENERPPSFAGNQNITIFFPIEKRNEKNQTVTMKLSKFSASITSQSDAFLTIVDSL
jgi:hypothetical protein